MKILLVEDQPKMAGCLKHGFQNVGYEVDIAETGKSAETLASERNYDLVVLDVMLPDQSGIDTARHLRRDGFSGPLLMLTALSSTKDKVNGLDAGADDYMTKPFSLEELMARIRALLRRSQQNQLATLKYSELELDLLSRKARRNGQEISLTTKEFSLLEFLMKNPERPLDRKTIAENVWEVPIDSESNVIDVYINLLRKKVDVPFEKRLIHTVIGTGYVLRETP